MNENYADDKMIYTVKEVSQIIHTNPAYVYSLINSGLLPALKLGSYKIRKSALIDFLECNEGNDLTDPYNIKPLNVCGNKSNL